MADLSFPVKRDHRHVHRCRTQGPWGRGVRIAYRGSWPELSEDYRREPGLWDGFHAAGDGAVGNGDELIAAAAHLNGHVTQSGALEFEARSLMVAGTANVANFVLGVLLELLNGPEHEIILA